MINPAIIPAHPMVIPDIGRPTARDSTVVGAESVVPRPVGWVAMINPAITPAHPVVIPDIGRPTARHSTVVAAESAVLWPIGWVTMIDPAIICTHPVVIPDIGRPTARDPTIVGAESAAFWPVGWIVMRNPAIIRAHPVVVPEIGRPAARDSAIIGAGSVAAWSIDRLPMGTGRRHVASIGRRIGVWATVVHLTGAASGASIGLWWRFWWRSLFLILGGACHYAKPQNHAKYSYSREMLHGIAKKLHNHRILVPFGGSRSTPAAQALNSTPLTLLIGAGQPDVLTLIICFSSSPTVFQGCPGVTVPWPLVCLSAITMISNAQNAPS
jgi:hypothetical protein